MTGSRPFALQAQHQRCNIDWHSLVATDDDQPGSRSIPCQYTTITKQTNSDDSAACLSDLDTNVTSQPPPSPPPPRFGTDPPFECQAADRRSKAGALASGMDDRRDRQQTVSPLQQDGTDSHLSIAALHGQADASDDSGPLPNGNVRKEKLFIYRCAVERGPFGYANQQASPWCTTAARPAGATQRKPGPRRHKRGSSFVGECYHCGGDGHSQNQCPLSRCYRCHRYGHTEHVCRASASRHARVDFACDAT